MKRTRTTKYVDWEERHSLDFHHLKNIDHVTSKLVQPPKKWMTSMISGTIIPISIRAQEQCNGLFQQELNLATEVMITVVIVAMEEAEGEVLKCQETEDIR